ncbi:helix-turn-helix transcriptional regulator [Saccharopolyspora sp. ASAGF58]|uniref:helix-turn-helix domain-containing protein n=1 Tax=Saccharopolyspora sp. ASAGF58 TaxID=2719023 RepID=UPI0014401CF0|nr:helix-turn-helix transcriptional regulator [Saccharopolyspora sp. ASAGF58]QIZ38950.1 helix-turn-helix domain-containing protein [Saccharopolyspora sp. ASAGF58]
MPGNGHTSVRSRQVAAQLRRLREQAQLSCSDVARTLGLSVSKVSRMETASSGMQIEDVAAMLGLYKVSATKRQEILDMLRRADEKGWWQRQAGLPQLWRNLIDFEAKPTRIQNFENMVVPGLLQTAEYCRALIQGINDTLSDEESDRLVATRMARQAVLTRTRAPQLLAVADENVLRRPVGGDGIMHRQLLHLGTFAERPNITLRVVQSSAGAYVGARGSFMILEFDGEPDLVHVENQSTGMFLEEDADLASYRLALSNILSAALKPAESADLVRQIAAEE